MSNINNFPIPTTPFNASTLGVLQVANNLSDVADASASRTNLGLAIGTDVQAFDAGLQSIAGLTTSANQGIYTTGADTYATFSLTAAGRALLDDANAAAQRTTLGVPGLTANNTLSGDNTFTGDVDLTNATVIGFSGFDPTASYNLTGLNVGGNATSLAGLKARSVVGLTGGETVTLNDGGRSGVFAWVTGNQSANVTNDPQQGMFVAPDSDPTGASGAWRRVNVPYVDGWVNAEWFGAVGNAIRRSNGNITAGSTAFTCGSSVFAATDVGKPIHIAGAGAAGGALVTTIAAFVSGTAVTLANAASTTVAGGATYGPLTAGSFAFGSNDQPAFQAAVNWIKSTTGELRGGTVRFGNKIYWIDGTIALDDFGITLQGMLPHRTSASNISVLEGGVLLGAALSGPVVGLWSTDTVADRVEIDATPGRAAVVVSRTNGTPSVFVYGNRQIPCGLSMETADVASGAAAVLVRAVAQNVLVRNQPAEGFLVVGETAHCAINDCTTIKVRGHGLAIESGNLANRTYKKFPGLGEIRNFRAFDTGGHGIAIGHPLNSPIPYRWFITNAEVFRNCQVAGMPYVSAGTFIYGEQMVCIGSAFGGMTNVDDPALPAGNGNQAVIPCLAVAGRDLQFLSCRYIRSAGDGHVILKDYAAVVTRLIKFIGGYAATTTTASPIPANFVYVAAADDNCSQIEIDGVGGDTNFTNYINDTTLAALRIVDNRAFGSNTSFFYNAPQNFAGTTVTIGAGAAATPSLFFTGDSNTGFFSRAADEVNLAAGGVEGLRVTSTQVLSAFTGSAAAPGISFSADADTGFYRLATNTIGFACNGALAGQVSPTVFSSASTFATTPRGSAAAPAFSFTVDSDTGLFSRTADEINLAAGGVDILRASTTQLQAGVRGTAALPVFSSTIDANTGMFFPFVSGNDAVGISTGGTERVRVKTEGVDILSGDLLHGGTKVVGAQQAAIADATSGANDAKINEILAALRAHGLIAT